MKLYDQINILLSFQVIYKPDKLKLLTSQLWYLPKLIKK